MTETGVLIVGCGPVGMTMAMDLAQRGVPVTVIEMRDRRAPPTAAKCNHISARTMEIFRRLGMVEAVRNAKGLPYDYANDVVHRTRVTGGFELSRIPIPCRRDRYTAKDGPDGWWPTPEPPHRLNQLYMEPTMFACFEAAEGITFLNQTKLDSFTQDETGVTATCTDMVSGETREIRAAYIVGCDGGSSTVRRAIGARFQGNPSLYDVQSTLIRAPELIGRMGPNPAWMICVVGNQVRNGGVFAIDGKELWLIHYTLRPGETFENTQREPNLRAILGVDEDFPFEVVSQEDWTARAMVADKFREGRAFICGDAAHAWVPMGGYGMNAGIASCIDLSWQLAAVLKGWAPETLIDAFEKERGPLEEQVSSQAMGKAFDLVARRAAIPPTIEDDTPEAEEARKVAGKANYDSDVQQYCCGGLNFGYYYDQSPIIAYDGEAQPSFTMYDFTPSTVPGCRLPYFELADGTPLYDRLGLDYTLLRFDPSVDVAPLVDAAAARGVPLAVLDIEGPVPAVYRHKLTISRPDIHVAWRGDACPDDALALIDKLRGAAN